jgi:anti-anti-sigma factor
MIEMEISRTEENQTVTLALNGRLNTSTSPQFQEALIAVFDEAKDIKLDFSNVTYVSSAGLRILLMGQKMGKAKNVSMKLLDVSEDVMEVFAMTGFADILDFAERTKSPAEAAGVAEKLPDDVLESASGGASLSIGERTEKIQH